MNDDQLREYARMGLTARLAELEREQSDLRALLASLTHEPEARVAAQPRAMSEDGRKRIGDAARRRWAAVRAAASDPIETVEPVDAPAPETARILPRRGRLERRPAAALPALPPMPRLIKARAS